MTHKPASGGYIGLLALIISLALIMFFAWRGDLLIPQNTGPSNIDTIVAPSTIQGQVNAIDTAKAARDQLQNKYNGYTE
jgi:hypothetical protein